MDLLISEPQGPPKRLKLEGPPLSLGRALDNDLAYPDDPWLSRYHLRVEHANSAWMVQDCGSRNGTRINGSALEGSHRLRRGDRIEAGKLIIDVDGVSTTDQVVEFIPAGETDARESTVVTNLSRILNSSAEMHAEEPDSGLSSARAVQALLRAGQELAGHRPLAELFPIILDLALSAVQARRGVIMTVEASDLIVRASRGREFSISTAVRDRVLEERASLMIEDAQIDRSLRAQHSIVAQRVRSILAVPLQTGSQVIGLLYIDNESVLQPFTHDDLALLTVMANVAAIRIEHARLAEIEQQEKLTAFEVAQAYDIQRGLLPEAAPLFERGEIAGINLPCRGVGGDYYDYLAYQDGRIAIALGDVCGKSLPAAILMSSLQARVQMLAETQPEPREAMIALNRSVCLRCPPGKFITFFYGVLNSETGELHFCNAGQNYPLVIRANGQVQQLSESDLVLGLNPNAPYRAQQTELESGDILALFSDGVVEARDAEGREFGEEGLADFLRRQGDTPVCNMIQNLQSTLRAWSGRESFEDDFTAVFVRWKA